MNNAKNEKRSQSRHIAVVTRQKDKAIFLKIAGILLALIVLSGTALCLLEYFNIINIPLFSSILDSITKLFETFESAIRYAEQNDGSTVKLLQDITLCRENVGSLISNYYIYLKTGTYTLDLAGKALTIGDGAESLQGLSVTGGCNLTVTDTVGDGKINSSRWGEVFEVRSDGHLTIESGDCTELSRVLAWGSDSLTIRHRF